MNFNCSVTEKIDQHEITIQFNGLTGREIVLVNGEEKFNRLNWNMKSDYLLQLDGQNHVRVHLFAKLDSTLTISFLRGGRLLAKHEIPLFSDVGAKVLKEPANAAWLAELKLPIWLSLLLPTSILLTLLFKSVDNNVLSLLLFAVLGVVCFAGMLKPPIATWPGTTRSYGRTVNGPFLNALLIGASVGGVLGYSVGVFSQTVSRLLVIS